MEERVGDVPVLEARRRRQGPFIHTHTHQSYLRLNSSTVSKVMGLSPPHSHSVLVHNLDSSVSKDASQNQ